MKNTAVALILCSLLSCSLIFISSAARADLSESQLVNVEETSAVRTQDPYDRHAARITIKAILSFTNTCFAPDVVFRDKDSSGRGVRYWIRGVNQGPRICTMLYDPIRTAVVVDTLSVGRTDPITVWVNGLPVRETNSRPPYDD